ncbi:MAG: protein-export chaperone SecB [Pseudomonadota bacterium]|nr:protein-export chaperone SecB [Pseudomonadota bacterium]
MSDPSPLANGADTNAAAQAQVAVQKIYVKDASFEAPSAPHIFQEQGQPQIQLNLNQTVNGLADGVYEVVLAVTVTCKIGDKNAYLAEVKQAGVFGLSGFDQASLHGVLGTFCPNTLFPYARQAISDMVLAGGFPPFLLQPINFDQIYVEQLRRKSAEAGAAPIANA